MARKKIQPADDNAAFIERIRQVAKQARLTVRSLAIAAGIPPTTLQNYVKWDRDVPRSAILSLARAGGVSPAWLLTGTHPSGQKSGAVVLEDGKIGNLVTIAEALNERFEGESVIWHRQIADEMEPTFFAGDIVLAIECSKPSLPGIYLFSSAARKFTARFQYLAGSEPRISFDHPRYMATETYDPKVHVCLGRVESKITERLNPLRLI